MSNHVLLKFESNWADEMDVEGFLVVTKEYWEDAKKELNKIEGECHLCVGTNEYINWSSGSEIIEEITVEELSEEEVKVFKKKFNNFYNYSKKQGVVAGFGSTGFLCNIGKGEGY